MAASIRTMPLPDPDSGRSTGSGTSSGSGSGGSKSAGGWDDSIADRFTFDASAVSMDSRRSCSISSHAVAHGCSVLGLRTPHDAGADTTNNSSDEEQQEEDWVAWEAGFEPNQRVCRVASNADGTVVVASTAAGTVSLMSGRDGAVLATRRVYSADDDDNMSSLPAEICFVSGADRHKSVAGDVLAILVPPREAGANAIVGGTASAEVDEFGNPLQGASSTTTTTTDDVPYINIILVSGIDGSRLNSSDPAEVASAARTMSIDALELALPVSIATRTTSSTDEAIMDNVMDEEDDRNHVVSLNACFVNERTIRFLVVDGGTDRLSAHDYDVKSKTAVALDCSDDLDSSLGSGNERWIVDDAVGIRVDGNNEMFLLSATLKSSIKILFLTVSDLKLWTDYTIQDATSTTTPAGDRPKMYALESVSSCDSCAAAAAIAFKPSASSADACIEVIQMITSGERGCQRPGPHLVYRVPITPKLDQEICWIDLASVGKGNQYSFRYKLSYNSGIGECVSFRGDEGDVVGRFRLLLALGFFDEADTMLASSGTAVATSSSQYGSVHGSEVALYRFKHILDSGSVSSAETMAEAKECLRRLSAGAVTGGDLGVKCLMESSDILLNWPTTVLSSDGRDEKILARDYRVAISAMSATIAGAMKAAPPSHLATLKAEKRRLDSKISAISCLETVASDDSREVFITPLLSDAASPADAFRYLVLQGSWVAAEQLRLSDFGDEITPEYMSSAIVSLPPHTDPRLYCKWLEEFVIPGLSINHPLLIAIHSWACCTADAFDDDGNGLGLDSSITLLKTVADATARLSATVHSSFSVDGSSCENGAADESRSLQETSSSSSLNASSSFYDEENSSRLSFAKPPPPAVMQLGLLRGAPRQKGSASFLARRMGARKASSFAAPSNPDKKFESTSRSYVETRKIYTQFVDNEMEAEAVEIKLVQALSLQQARELGLPNHVATLRTYSDCGGSDFIAKELVRLLSSRCSSDAESKAKIVESIQPFCSKSGTDFSTVLVMYTKELCDGNRNNPNVLLEAASLSRLCTGSARCDVALKVLRAALLCNEQPPALSDLSKEAIEWAVDDEMRSELEEAARLLVIDRIVRRYCGNGAQELFRVSDPRHGLRLLHFVCRHIDGTTTIPDALALCDAFTHLSKKEACVLILKRMALAAPIDTGADANSTFRADQCGSLLRLLYSRDAALAEKVGEETCIYFAETLEETASISKHASSEYQRRMHRDARAASAAAINLLSVMQENESKLGQLHQAAVSKTLSRGGTASWSTLLQKLYAIHELQGTFGIYLSASDLESETKREEVCKLLLRPAVALLVSAAEYCPKALNEALCYAKRGIGLLFCGNQGEISSYWCKAVGYQACHLAMNAADDSRSVYFLQASGLLDDLWTDSAFDAIHAVATAHCIRASNEALTSTSIKTADFTHELNGTDNSSQDTVLMAMRCIIRASSLLEDHALQFCPCRLLGPLASLTCLTDAMSQVLVRGDDSSGEAMESFRVGLNEESRRRRESDPHVALSKCNGLVENNAIPITTPLHRDWYVGDGLLLPPLEALAHCMDYCKKFIALTRSPGPNRVAAQKEGTIFSFLNGRGAHTIALRLRASLSALEMAPTNEIAYKSSSDEKTSMIVDIELSQENKNLAERSLGGSGSGITSGSIDSQLAFGYLLSLPIKLAFKVYRACLPSAISKRDFVRVVTLACIGIRAGDGTSSVVVESSMGKVVAWKKQDIFVAQCRRLASNARWWSVLQSYGVAFDPKRFEGRDKSKVDAYVASLVLPLISHSCKTLLSASAALAQVLDLATKFVRAYGLDEKLAAQKHVEFLLSVQAQDDASSRVLPKGQHFDVRGDLKVCERAARDTLLLLPSPMARAAILRRCLIALESTEECFKDYDRYASVISLYLEELSFVLADKSNKADFAAFQQEFENIDKRQDALLILTSFFQDRTVQERPSFPAMFLPLPTPFKSDMCLRPTRNFCGVLGAESSMSSPDDFDPILPLIPSIAADGGASSVAALSPLCFSLGVPTGTIHARSLHLRFKKATEKGASLPPFEACVRPVINRLKGSHDAAELSEWCAMKYPDGSKDRLNCLELALSHAMRASSEAEQRARMHKGDDAYVKNERRSLDTVKRISDLKSALADRVKFESVLADGYSLSSGASRHVKSILSRLVDQVYFKNLVSGHLTPEAFVENILLEASAMTANAVMAEEICFTMDNFREVAVSVHRACQNLADGHSHVDIGHITRRLARRWLVHGYGAASPVHNNTTENKKADTESTRNGAGSNENGPSTPTKNVIKVNNDDTEEFVMNLNDLEGEGDVWSDDVGSANAGRPIDSSGVMVADEESSALTIKGCAREVMERANAIVSLRIAFVMSFAFGYHAQSQHISASFNAAATSRPRRTPLTSSKLNRSLSKSTKEGSTIASIGESSRTRGDTTLDHARELLGIAFAKRKVTAEDEGLPLLSELSPSMQNSSMSMSIEGSMVATDKETVSQDGKVHSFAMRYRAIRVATILCPKEALDYVILSEGYGGEQSVDLDKCTFASFLAMEAEAMGLQIPSSDLVALSTMSFASYARALWRNHGHDANGRLLLMLLELCLRDGKKQNGIDGAFLLSLLSELSQKQLPRSLLKSLGLIAANNAAARSIKSLATGQETLERAVERSATLILQDLQSYEPNMNCTDDFVEDDCINTIQRLRAIVTALSYKNLPIFVQALCRFTVGSNNERLGQELTKVAAYAASSINAGELRVAAFSEVVKAGGRHHLERSVCVENSATVDMLFGHYETAFTRDVKAAVASVGKC